MNLHVGTTSIRVKTTLFVVLTLGVLTALMVTIQFRTSLNRVEDIENDRALDDAARITRQLDASLDDVGGTNSDWAWWDASYEFVQDGNDDYRDSNLYADAFVPIGIDLVAYINTDGKVVHDARYDEEAEYPVAESFLDLARPGGLLAADDDPGASPGGIVRAGGVTYLATSRAILPSDQGGDPAGVLLMARAVTDAYTAELAELTNLHVVIAPCEEVDCSVGRLETEMAKTADDVTTTRVVAALDGSPALRVEVTTPRTVYQESVAGIQRVLIILTGVGLVAVLITIAGISRLVVDPLDRLASTVAEVARANDPSLRTDLRRSDEIGDLADGMNIMLSRLENSQTQLIEANERIQGASEAKSRFLSHVSHELRTPINGVLAYAQLLQLDELDPEADESVGQIITAARHIGKLVDEFLDIARIEAGAIPLTIESINPVEVADEVVSMTQPLASSQSTSITIEGPDDAVVMADVLRLRQVLLNLTSNAIKYGAGDRPIEIVIGDAGPNTTIAVRDHGQGIPADQLHRLFIPFDRLDADSGNKQGTGIGLSVTKQLVELMDGAIEVTSSPGQGTTFTVSLPASASTPSGTNGSRPDAATFSAKAPSRS